MATNNKEIVGDLPIILSQAIPTALVKYQREDFAASYAIGNTPWLSAASDQNRISRITTTYQKERIDQGSSAGENSLSNWWLRSATSWHHGAGERYYDGDASDIYRYYESNNIDPWTVGELRLLKKTTQLTTASVCGCATTADGGTFYLSGGNVYFYKESDGTSTSTALSTTATAQRMTGNGSVAIVGASDGIYTVSTSMVVSKLWSSPTTSWTVQAINFVKDRIVCGVHLSSGLANTYELSINPSSPPKQVSSTELRYTYPNTSLNYVSVAELNSSILVGYTVGAVSRIHGHAIDDTSPLAAIKDPIVVAELPRGETLNQVRSYLNEYVVLATNRGVRIGTQDSDGQGFVYGPLTIEDDIKDVAFDSSFVYATRNKPINANNGLWRINIGQPIDSGYAYAPDLVTSTSTVTGIAFVGTSGRKFITTADGVWIEHPTEFAATGTISSGLIRWGTAENKQPVSIAIRTNSLGGTIGFSVADQDGIASSIESIPLDGSTEFQLSASLQPSDNFEITLTLSRSSTDPTISPVIEEWQCRALPAPLRSRTITLPLLCYEEERDPNGVTRVSNPWERINYLERIEQNGGAVLYQDFSSGEERVCTIRAIQFEQSAPPSFASGFGGIVTIQLQTIDTEVPIQ